ncbi:winged helix-turn-helix domain-containing protein [Actinacidiphila epipremni]|uniref:Helix-turn-helix transcriptional regulator n=1 Tax=Actinacidiphila epipremni TaxID=2053013 RepID=A0ABX0ZT33_9ACTN|nr:winged helix-turn-helix domain-containing protein [Actinacidiphila epipremni]NJP45459.1 helix-turn-helix transcriptional regulator [Actinacidiphila epipremni]
MTEDELEQEGAASAAGRPGARRKLPDHPIRLALLDLIAEEGTLTATRAAARLGQSSGLCSFHLRQLARHGLVEEAPHPPGRGGPRPWRLRWEDNAVTAPPGGFTEVLHLTPEEATTLTATLREALAPYAGRSAPPPGAVRMTVQAHFSPPGAEPG